VQGIPKPPVTFRTRHSLGDGGPARYNSTTPRTVLHTFTDSKRKEFLSHTITPDASHQAQRGPARQSALSASLKNLRDLSDRGSIYSFQNCPILRYPVS
jgi:hypothetical protein